MPDAPPICERSLHAVEHILRRTRREGSDPHLLDECDVPLLLAGHDVADEKRDLSGDRLLHSRAPRFSDKKMVGGHQFRHLIRPSRERAMFGEVGRRDGVVGGFAAAGDDIHGDMLHLGKKAERGDGADGRAAGEKQHLPRQRCGLGLELFKPEPHREAQHVDFVFGHPVRPQDLGRVLVGNDRAVARATVPRRVDLGGIRDHREKRDLHRRVAFPELGVQERKNRVRRGDDMGLEFPHERPDGRGEFGEHRPHPLDDPPPAEEFEHDFPRAGIPVDRHGVAALHQAVHDGVRAGIGVGHEDFGAPVALGENGVGNIPRGGVVTFPHAGGQEKNPSLFGVWRAQADLGVCMKREAKSRIRMPAPRGPRKNCWQAPDSRHIESL